MEELLYPAIGAVIAWGARKFLDLKWWGRIRRAAVEIAKQPERTSDPQQAMVEALLQAQLDRLADEAGKVAKMLEGVPDYQAPNGHDTTGRVPLLDLSIKKNRSFK